MRKLFQILFFISVCMLPALASANSLEYYEFDDTFFSGSYSPEYYVEAQLHFAWNGNDFGGKIFFQDIKMIETTQLNMDGGGQLYCNKQVRGFYINTARGNRVRPLDEDSLAYLQSVDSSYNSVTMTGGLFICGLVDNGVYGYIQHTWSGESYSLMAGADYDFDRNMYVTGYWSYPATFLFENNISTGYLRDNYGGITQLSGAGLDVLYACGDSTIDPGESCDDGINNGQLNFCNLTCNSITTSVCGNAVIETQAGETCDEGSGTNGQPGHCNLACNGMIPNPVTPGPTGPPPTSNICSSVDCSTQVSPLCCLTPYPEIVDDITTSTGFALPNNGSCSTVGSPYSVEMTEAFSFAYSHNITSQCPITKANLNGALLRKHAAKMISQFAISVLGKKPDSLAVCEFNDMANETPEMKYYAKLACKLGLMGLKSDGTPDTKFTPNGEVTRAQFGTMLSRLLYGNANNAQPGKRYEAHLNALKTAGIMTKISNPAMLELRGYVMIMMERIAE